MSFAECVGGLVEHLITDVAGLFSHVLGRNLSPRYIGSGPLMAAATVSEAVFRILRRQPPLRRETVRMMTHSHAYDGSRATEELGLEYTPVEDTLRRTTTWLETEGFLGS